MGYIADIEEWKGGELEAKIMELAIATKPENFEDTYEQMQELLNEQNRRGQIIAKKYGKRFFARSVADVFNHYWLHTAQAKMQYNDAKRETENRKKWQNQ